MMCLQSHELPAAVTYALYATAAGQLVKTDWVYRLGNTAI